MFNLFKKKDYKDVYGVDKDDIGKVICSNNNKNKINKKELEEINRINELYGGVNKP